MTSNRLDRALRLCVFLLFASTQAFSQFQYGSAHTGLNTASALYNSVDVSWRVQTGGAVRSTPAVVNDRLVAGSADGSVSCLGLADGRVLWKFTADASVTSSPAVEKGIAYVTSRKNTLYALSVANGRMIWKRTLGETLPYEWGFDYYVGSPSVGKDVLFTGSGDGRLYAIDLRTQKILWTFDAASIIRSTPALDSANVYFGDMAGRVYALDRSSGKMRWRFATAGDTLQNERFGFDRKAVIASPTLYQDKLIVGGRDGFLYALERATGRLLWKYDYEVSWIISTAAVSGGILVTGTSDGRFVHALDVDHGTELWRFPVLGPVWASPAIAGNGRLAIAGNDGYIYCLELRTGAEVWRQKLGPQIFSSTVLHGSALFVGSDDGCITALATREETRKPVSAIKRAVFWMKDPPFQAFRGGMDAAIREYFVREGYAFVDESDIAEFFLARMKSDTASVVVFATNYFPSSITRDTLGSNLLRSYLKAGGKAVILGMNPAVYQLDSVTRRVTGLDFSLSERITGIPYRFNDLRSHRGFYFSQPTPEGRKWGLKHSFVAIAGMPVTDITVPLAIDENGRATAWVKQFSARKGAGFVQLYLTPERLNELPEIREAAEYGLR